MMRKVLDTTKSLTRVSSTLNNVLYFAAAMVTTRIDVDQVDSDTYSSNSQTTRPPRGSARLSSQWSLGPSESGIFEPFARH